MLQYLRIKNLALLEKESLDLKSGFIGITGETGAGKSVLLGALRILSGARVDKTLIRQGADTCEVEAALHLKTPSKIDAFLEELGLPVCEENTLLLRRTISKNKSPRISINGVLTTLAVLQQIGELWIDFHGPGEPQKLFHEKHQLSMLDFFAQTQSIEEQYLAYYIDWRKTLKEIETLQNQEHLNEDEIQFLQSQIEKIEQVNPSPESIEQLENDYNLISKSQEVLEHASTLETALSGESGISHQLSQLVKHAQVLTDINPSSAQALSERLQSLIIESEDLSAEFSALCDQTQLDEEQMSALHERMDIWLEIKRKYGPDLESVLTKHQSLINKINSQSDIEGAISALQEQAEILKNQASELAKQLSIKRQKAALKLSPQVSKLLKNLGFKHAQIEISITEVDALSDQGINKCSFKFAPNAGQDLLPLNKIASSGETARVMLALKAILAQADKTPVLVFDEVDSNVGGEIGAEVGKCLAELGQNHQVICVTHLPQVGAQSSQHFVVDKKQTAKTTSVTIKPIHTDKNKRLKELARMLGDRESASALKHAEVLMAS